MDCLEVTIKIEAKKCKFIPYPVTGPLHRTVPQNNPGMHTLTSRLGNG